MITRKDAESLKPGDVLYHNTRGSDRRPRRARVNGKPQVWVTRPLDFRIPAKHGLYDTFQITPQNANEFHLSEEEAVATLQPCP